MLEVGLLLVVDHPVAAEREGEPGVVPAADADHLGGAEVPRDLHREAAHPADRADDQHPLAGAQASVVAQGLQRGQAGERDGGGFGEGGERGFRATAAARTAAYSA